MSETSVSGSGATPIIQPAKPWPFIGRVAFRLVFCYSMLYVFFNGNDTPLSVFDRLPFWQGKVGALLFWPIGKLSLIVGKHVFHLSGIAATWHFGGSGDTALNWILSGILLAISVAATGLWSLLDWKRESYSALYAWLRFAIRLMLGVSMLTYGFVKVFPLQMLPISVGQLNEPLGQLTPMSMLWSMLALSPVYQMICGAAELAAGILILIRRTALAGALLTVFVMSNVLLYNLFFDVPVKLFAAHLVVLASFLVWPDVVPLWRFFVLHVFSKPAGIWAPPPSRWFSPRAMRIFEPCFLVLCLLAFTTNTYTTWSSYRSSLAASPLTGVWKIRESDQELLKSPTGKSCTDIFVDNTFRAFVRDSSGKLWRNYLKYSPKGTLDMRDALSTTSFTWKVVDPDHVALTKVKTQPVVLGPVNPFSTKGGQGNPVLAPAPTTLILERQRTAQSYPIYGDGFHLVTEWGYER